MGCSIKSIDRPNRTKIWSYWAQLTLLKLHIKVMFIQVNFLDTVKFWVSQSFTPFLSICDWKNIKTDLTIAVEPKQKQRYSIFWSIFVPYSHIMNSHLNFLPKYVSHYFPHCQGGKQEVSVSPPPFFPLPWALAIAKRAKRIAAFNILMLLLPISGRLNDKQ